MSNQDAIYDLSRTIDPRFGCLEYKAKKSFFGHDSPIEDWWSSVDLPGGGWNAHPLAKVWTPQPVGGDVAPFVDYPCLEFATPAFSPKAVQALRPMLEESGELLELRHKNGSYFGLNVTKQSDALDVKKSMIKWFSDEVGISANDIKRFEFHKSRLRGLSLFQLKQTPQFVLVTEDFKQRVEAAALNGFQFTKVWPLPPGTYWRDAQIQARRAATRKLDLYGESLMLRFRPQNDRASPKEKKRVQEFADELNALLTTQQTITDPYYGSVEGTEFVKGDCRIFLSCPKVEDLIEYLGTWINGNDWPGEFHIVKRFGNLYDTKAKEKRIAIK